MAQAVVIEQYGGPEVLQLKQVDVPAPGAGQVRIKHTRIGVNFHDVYVRSGLYKTLPLPGTPGIEAVGVIEECGANVDRWKVGDRIAYVTGGYGVYASERLMNAAELLHVPDDISDTVAASALLRGLTVEMLLRRVHNFQPGDWVLVQAAAGGVGQLLCQWASHIGARVIGTVAASFLPAFPAWGQRCPSFSAPWLPSLPRDSPVCFPGNLLSSRRWQVWFYYSPVLR